ncbi:MAG: TerB N-terminal domain-containing protein [Enterovibrio sp.]
MELLFILCAALVICILLIHQCIKKFSSKQSNKNKLVTENARMQSESNDDELVTFTISTSHTPKTTRSHNTAKGRWINSNAVVYIAEKEIHGGLFYLGGRLPNQNGFGTDASLIDDTLTIHHNIDMHYQDETLGYWPSFNSISASSRGAYLSWLASERNDPEVPLGYVFLYFYGLERRIVIDSQKEEVTDIEFLSIYREILRLRAIYGFNNSFSNYSLRLMELMSYMRHEIVTFDEQNAKDYNSLLFRYRLATLVSKQEPIPAQIALTWLKNSQEYTLRTPARRCAEQFFALFQQQYTEQFGDGIIVKPNKTRLTIQYHAASASLQDCSLEQPDLPDPFVLKAPVKKLIMIAEKCTELLSAYSRYMCKKGVSADDVEAMLLLPDSLFNVQSHPALKKFKDWANAQLIGPSNGLVSLVDLWQQMELTLPERINKREIEFIVTLAAKGGFGVAPDPRYHHAKLTTDSKIVLFLKGNDPHFKPSQAFNQLSMAVRLGAMVATVDNHIDSTELSTLYKLIEHDINLSPFEKRSLHAYLHWCLNTPANMTGIKERISTLNDAGKEVVRSILVTVAIADGNVSPDEIKQIEKLYTALGLDKAQVAADIHKLTSSKGISSFLSSGNKAPTQKKGFVLNEELLALHSTETHNVQNLLGTIFIDDQQDTHELDENKPNTVAPIALDQAHNSLFKQLITKEHWDRKDVLAVCESLKLMLDGAIETINDWAYEQAEAPVIEDDEDIYIDLEIANELKAG